MQHIHNLTYLTQHRWDAVEHKRTTVVLAVGGTLSLVVASSVVNALDRVPLVSDLLIFMGLLATYSFVWKCVVLSQYWAVPCPVHANTLFSTCAAWRASTHLLCTNNGIMRAPRTSCCWPALH
jgi:hypothetical protein